MNFRPKKKSNQRNLFLPNKPKVALKLKSFLTDLIYMIKITARLTPSTPKIHILLPTEQLQIASGIYLQRWLTGYLFLPKSPLIWKKIAFMDFTCVSIQIVSPKSFCQSKTNPDLSYNHLDLIYFSQESLKSFVFMLHWNGNKFWSFTSFHRTDLLASWPLATAAASSLLQHSLPTHFSHVQQHSQKLV